MNSLRPLLMLSAICLSLPGLSANADGQAQAKQAKERAQELAALAKAQAAAVQAQAEARELAVVEAAAEAVEGAAAVSPDPPAEAATEKPEENKQTQEELRKQMQELENQLAQKRNAYQQKAREAREKQKQEAKNNIKNIKLPENPTREQSEAYLAELREAAKNVNSYSSSDPLVGKLKEIPAEHFDLLIGEIHNRTKLRYFCNYAMRDIDTEVLRDRFVASVDNSEHGIAVIVMHGWVEDVRESVIRRMETADGSLSPSWFQAAVELDEPSLYPKLHEVTINSRYASQFINMLKALPDYDLTHTVNVCWKRSRQNKLSISSSTISNLATEHGNVEALGYLIGQLRYSSSYMSSSSSYNSRRVNVLRYIDFRGSNKEINDWYNANKENLVFDHYRKRFVLPEGVEPLEKPVQEQDEAVEPDNEGRRLRLLQEGVLLIEGDLNVQLELIEE